MKRYFVTIIAAMAAATASVAGPAGGAALNAPQNAQKNAAQSYVEQLKTTEELKESAWGIKAVKLDGTTVAGHNSGTRLLPASITKLITTGVALNELGPDYRFRTAIAYSGSIEDGVLLGDLYIIGGADPTIGARDSVAIALQETFAQWMKFVTDAGITKIEGRIIGDGRFIDGEYQNLSWQIEDGFCGDGTGMTGLSFYRNLQDARVSPGQTVGAAVKVEQIFPETPWMNWYHTCTTAPKGEGNDLYFACTNLAPVASLSGTYAIDQPRRRVTCANSFGAMTCAYYFYRYLEQSGILAGEGPADIDPLGYVRDFESPSEHQEAALPAGELKTLGVYDSPALRDIVRQTNFTSDNFYAETLLRVLAKEQTGSACYDSCATVESRALARLGVKPAGRVQIMDGSGLGRKNYISPDFFVDFLTAMHGSDVFDDYLRSLPQPGSYGTLQTRMSGAAPSVRSRVYMKSGSMNGVRCFSGYILPSDGKPEETIVFSVMTNNTIVAASRINFIMDKIIGLLAAEN